MKGHGNNRQEAVSAVRMFLVFLIMGYAVLSCAPGNSRTASKPIKIGFSMDSFVVERWQRDQNIFVAAAKKLGAEVVVQYANQDFEKQGEQVRYLISQDVDVLVVIPNDGQRIAPIIDSARRKGIKVIAYDRLILNANLDLYISFDNVKSGQLMGQALLSRVPAGNYVIINGAVSDNNSSMLNSGLKSVLTPGIQGGRIRVVKEVWLNEWSTAEAKTAIEEILSSGTSIDALFAGNDTLAETIIHSLAERQMAGKVVVVGQDADLSACQRLVEGTQLMTIYKPIDKLAVTAARAAVALAKGEAIPYQMTLFNGVMEVPYLVLEPIPVFKENLEETVIKDGFHTREDIYRHLAAPKP